MRTTTTALAVGATALVIPAGAHAAHTENPTLRPPLGGHATVGSQMRAERRELTQARLTRRATHLARRVAHARDHGFSPRAYRRDVRDESPARLADRVRALRRDLHRASAPSAPPRMEAIAACESGGNPRADTGNGFYGKYQFTAQTWASVGGHGNPAEASEAEQDRRAAQLYAREGASPWPVCGR
jgi:hypothetical protein